MCKDNLLDNHKNIQLYKQKEKKLRLDNDRDVELHIHDI